MPSPYNINNIKSALFVQPQSDAQGIKARGQNMKEYNDAVQPSQTDSSSPNSVPQASNVDKVNAGKSAKYGAKPGEKRPEQMQSFKNGGKVKGGKTGTKKVVITHVGERVASVKQTKKLEKMPAAMAVLSGKK